MKKSIKTYDSLRGEELARLEDLFRTAFATEKGETWQPEQIQNFLKRGAPEKFFAIIYDDDGIIAGFASSHKLIRGLLPSGISIRRAYYNDVDIVSTEHRGDGIGKQLLNMRVDHIYENNLADRMVVRMRADNKPVQAVYATLGFNEAHRYDLTYHGIQAERLVLEASVKKLYEKIHGESKVVEKVGTDLKPNEAVLIEGKRARAA